MSSTCCGTCPHAQIDRQSFAIAIGGGAVLDAVGFAAAIFHRGVRHIRCPTTVLAQDDSGVGVKNAINAFGFKNLLGTFAPPFAVINDFGVSRHAARAREARRHGGSREGRADPRRGFLPLARARGRRAGALRARTRSTRWCGVAPSCTCTRSRMAAIRSRPDRRGRSTTVTGRRTSSKGSPAMRCGTARRWRSGSRLTRAIRCWRACSRRARTLRVLKLLARLGFTLWDDALELRDEKKRRRVIKRARRLPGASRRRADRHAARRHRARRRGPRHGPRADRAIDPLAQGAIETTLGRWSMRLDHLPGEVHLTYCTNIHAGESWDEVRDSLEAHLPRIKAAVSPARAARLGLRLSAVAARRLSKPAAFEELRAFLVAARSLRLHDQCVSLRPVSWDAGEGGRLPARLARRPNG